LVAGEAYVPRFGKIRISNTLGARRMRARAGEGIVGQLSALSLFVGAVGRGPYETLLRQLIKRTGIIFTTMIETMLDVRRAI
jgi:hypothetical protein